MRLSEYMDTIRGVIVSVQENESVCVSFVESMPSYADLTNWQDFSVLQKMEYIWYKDEVQTARILFYLRVIPTCIECVTAPIFRQVLVPTMFLYMGHPNKKVARASHSMFVGFISSGKDSDQDERVSLKEKLVFYYIERSLAEYPGTTPFKGMASGVVALVRHLPTGSPAIFYCINSFVVKANRLCGEQGESEPCKEIIELLLRLISLVDIQVLSNLMKLLAQLIMKLPKDGQNLVLNELFSLVVESDDVTRKPTLVSWLQSLSYLCSQDTSRVANSTEVGGDKNSVSAQATNSSDLHARL
ncbi:Obscurin-like protein [Citrus sinensis]|nr:Obscurin-like protein [Citrus sinensis]